MSAHVGDGEREPLLPRHTWQRVSLPNGQIVERCLSCGAERQVN